MMTEVRTLQPGRIVAPYVTARSAEQDLRCDLTVRPDGCGVGYARELLGDRDGQGVLWARVAERPVEGRPEFARVHPLGSGEQCVSCCARCVRGRRIERRKVSCG